jgi:hypothetical protein
MDEKKHNEFSLKGNKMIDYEKLKIAHELGQSLSNKTGMRVDISLVFMDKDSPGYLFVDYTNDREQLFELNGIDLLINDLQILTEPKPKPKYKYKSGQSVWYIDCTKYVGPICEGMVEYNDTRDALYGERKNYVCVTGDLHIPEDCVYPTKQALIKAQITYWQSFLQPELTGIGSECNIPMSVADLPNDCIPKEKECPKCHQLIFTEPCPCPHKSERQIQEAPFLGKLSREEIKRAVESVSKPIKEECKHLNQSISMTGNTSGTNSCLDCKQEIPFQWSIDCNPKPKEGCQHESDTPDHHDYLQCKKCGEFYR